MNEGKKRMKRKGNSFWQRAALSVIFLLVACYTFYHMLGLFQSEMETYAAGISTETKVLSYSGYIFRDETVLSSSYTGVVDYRVRDGVKVSEGQELAYLYEEGSASLRESVRRLDDQIYVLERGLASSAVAPDMGQLKEELKTEYLSLMKLLAEGDATGLSQRSEDFLVALNRMDTLVHKDSSAGYETLEALREMKRELLDASGASELCRAERSGYFYSEVDGYEQLFTPEAVSEENLSAESFYELLSAMEEDPFVEEGAFGKLCLGSEWKMVLPIALSDLDYFTAGETYSGVLKETSEVTIPLTLEYVKTAEEYETALLVFSADRMTEGFLHDRCQNVSIEVERVSGIYVPKNVVVREGGGRGVYILRGSVVHFRYVEILREGSDYYLVKPNLEKDEHGRLFLQVNDLIILNGKNLFDGRVMD